MLSNNKEARREYLRQYQKRWLAKRRATWFADKKCEWCGSITDLELDHIDRATKIANSIWSWSIKRRDEELLKCRVLCYECHKKRTKEQFTKVQVHGTNHSYKKCKCKYALCRKASAEIRKRHRDKHK